MNNDYIITEINPENLSLKVSDIDFTDYGLEPTWKIEKAPALHYSGDTGDWSFLLTVPLSECMAEYFQQVRGEAEWDWGLVK